MAEYIEREAFSADIRESYCKLQEIYDTLHYEREKEICSGELGTFCEILMRVKEFPAADVVEVVRCKDCKHENVHHAISDKHTWCEYWGIDPDFDDFCSYGERKDNDATD